VTLRAKGLFGAIVGRALYEGAIELRRIVDR
jgi:phosphoribosylformimino-5-aminoimidazole carboxamide ribonucleotide (ProFAR) isomerase